MHPLDESIFLAGTCPEPRADAVPLPPGESYYWDARAEGLGHAAACRRAARQMHGAAISLGSVWRSR